MNLALTIASFGLVFWCIERLFIKITGLGLRFCYIMADT